MPQHPWDTGDVDRNWEGYFLPDRDILRNRIGARTADELRDAENDLVEARAFELREDPGLLGARTYDLTYLQAIHRHLFQDVYEWAGDLRTVGIEKGGESFCPPINVRQAMEHVALKIHELNQLRDVPETDLADEVAYLYEYVNFAHPFREGNAARPASSSIFCYPSAAPGSIGGRPIWTSCTVHATLRELYPTAQG